jgi:hypothetical protein
VLVVVMPTGYDYQRTKDTARAPQTAGSDTRGSESNAAPRPLDLVLWNLSTSRHIQRFGLEPATQRLGPQGNQALHHFDLSYLVIHSLGAP